MKENINKDLDKNGWVNEVMSSIQGIQPAQPPVGLYEKTIARINNPAKVKIITLPVKQWAAAAILLLALNVGSAIYAIEQDKKHTFTNTSSPLASEIQLESTYNY